MTLGSNTAGHLFDTSFTTNGILYSAASGVITSIAPSATSGVPVISQGVASAPTYGTTVVAGGGTGSVTFNIDGVVISGTSTTSALTALTLTSGQLVIGGTTTPAAATLSAGTGISIANANNSITINSTGGGLTWTDVTGASATMAVQNGYLADNAGLVTLALPATAIQFSVIAVQGYGAGGWTITQAAGQQIIFGSVSSTAGVTGSISSTNRYDCLRLIAAVGGASTIWVVQSAIGNLTVS